jgi:hypothetical protein
MVVSPSSVPAYLDQELNGSKSHIGLRKIIYYLKYKIVVTPYCFTGPDLLIPAYTLW